MTHNRMVRGWRGEQQGGVGHVSSECLFSIAHFYLTAVSQSRMVVHGGKVAEAIMSVFGLFFFVVTGFL